MSEYVLVPKEPTEAMCRAAWDRCDGFVAIQDTGRVWSAMIAACLPAAPTGETGA